MEFWYPDRPDILKLWKYCYDIIRYAEPGTIHHHDRFNMPKLSEDGYAEYVRQHKLRRNSHFADQRWATDLFNQTLDWGFMEHGPLACFHNNDVIFMDQKKYGCRECLHLFPNMKWFCHMCTDCINPLVPAIIKLQSFMRGRSIRGQLQLQLQLQH